MSIYLTQAIKFISCMAKSNSVSTIANAMVHNHIVLIIGVFNGIG